MWFHAQGSLHCSFGQLSHACGWGAFCYPIILSHFNGYWSWHHCHVLLNIAQVICSQGHICYHCMCMEIWYWYMLIENIDSTLEYSWIINEAFHLVVKKTNEMLHWQSNYIQVLLEKMCASEQLKAWLPKWQQQLNFPVSESVWALEWGQGNGILGIIVGDSFDSLWLVIGIMMSVMEFWMASLHRWADQGWHSSTVNMGCEIWEQTLELRTFLNYVVLHWYLW